jgi:hypothetical protein
MVANTHNPAPATAHDTPMYPRVTINATQTNIYKALIRTSPKRRRIAASNDPVFTDCREMDRDFALVE